MESQCNDILAYMKEYGGITNLEAINRLGVGNLKGRIFDLRQKGHKIHNVPVEFKTIHGRKGRYVRYVLEKQV